jgi:putative membrane-bound dehydrogenase-like protein
MEDLGRDAIYFDVIANPADLNPGMMSHFDAALLADEASPAILASLKGQRRVLKLADLPDSKTAREKILSAIAPQAKNEWKAFLEQREPEKREPNANVANYEKRPQPITFQFPFSPKGSIERTQVPPDMRLELFAAEPDIMKPIAFAWDERGRLWVAETRDYPHGVVENGEGNDDIKICEDTDGDGRADKFTVFADHLNLPTSLVFANGGVIVAQPPRFLFLKSRKGDDHADIRQVIMDAWGIRDTHAQASNLHYGYDNWLRGAVGYSGIEGVVGGKKVKFTMGSYRFRADGSAIEFLHQFTNNTWAQSQNEWGDDFGGTANGAPIFFGGIPATVAPDGVRCMTAKKINIVETAHAITPNYRQVDVFHGFTAAAGSNFIYSKNLPERLQGKAMVCEPTMKIITLMDVQRDGAGFIAKDGFNLVASSDEWHSPVHAEVGPDGAIWYADWQNFIIQHNPTPSVERGGYNAETGPGGAHKNDLRDHSRGRIYRIVWDKAEKPAIHSLKDAGTAQLVRALGGDTQFWRLKAQQLLVEEKKTDAADALKKMVTANDGSIAAIHALWTLQGLGHLDEATHKAALLAKDAGLRRNAIRALDKDEKARALFFGSGVISDPDLTTRLAAFVKLAEFSTTEEVKTLVKRLNSDLVVKNDEWLHEAGNLLAHKHKALNYHEGPNLLPNAGFEIIGANGFPEGWARRDYGKKPGNAGAQWEVLTGGNNVHSGEHAVRCITRDDADTSLHADVAVKPHTEYRLSAWVRAHALKGKVSLNDHLGRAETDKVTRDTKGEWQEIEVIFNSKERSTASINLLHVAKGDGYFDDVKLCEIIIEDDAEKVVAGDPERGENIFWHHPIAACMNCHMLGGKGGPVGPPLDGIAGRKDEAYVTQSLLEPNAVLAQGYEYLKISPMPPMGLILKPQELADVKAFIMTLKEQPKPLAK